MTDTPAPNPYPNLKRWPKGVSGNPGGKPKGVEALIRDKTNGGRDLINNLIDISRSPRVAAMARVRATEILMNRLWPVKTIQEVTGTVQHTLRPDLSVLSDEEIAQYLALQEKVRLAPELPEPDDDVVDAEVIRVTEGDA